MSLDFDPLPIDLPRINQIGIVVSDVEDAMTRYSALLGIDGWRVFDFEAGTEAHSEMSYRDGAGEYSMRAAVSADVVGDELQLWRGDKTEIELMAPTGGESCYTTHLDRHGEGLQHIACWEFDDPGEVVAELQNVGVEILQEGFVFGTKYVYLDTRDLLNGVVFETVTSIGEKPEVAETPHIWDVVM